MIENEECVGLFLKHVQERPERLYARWEGRPITFGDLDRASAVVAGRLLDRGVAPGRPVAVMMRNSPFSLAAVHALWRAGFVWVPVNTGLRGAGLAHVLDDSRPDVVIADAEFASEIASCGAASRPATWFPESDGLPEGEVRLADRRPDPGDRAAVMYTSGTTGPAKGVIVTHRMLRLAAEAVATCSTPVDGDDYFMWEPFFHIGGAQVLLLPLIRDVTLTLASRFSASRFWQQVREAGSTHIHHLGGVLQILLKQPPAPDDRDHAVRVSWGGGCPPEIWRRFEERFGVDIRECYGMTEASSLTTCNVGGPVGSVGRPMPWFTVRIVDEEGRELREGRGEIVVETSLPGAIFPGYLGNPEATARALRPDGFHTGDVGSFDADGWLHFHGRLTDSVRVRGENVSAWEVEHVAASHPDVADCALIGVATDVGEQDIKLFVQPKPGVSIDPAALSAWLGERLAAYQRPRYIAFVEAFERTPSERIMKHGLSRATDDCWDGLRREEPVR